MASQSVDFGGVQVANLNWVKRYKRFMGREKDMRDIAFLRIRENK